MNWLDVVIVLVLAWFTLTSLRTGFLREILSLLGLLVGIYLAGRHYEAAAGFLFPRYISILNLAKVLGFLGIVVATWAAASLLAFVAHKGADLLLLGWADHLGGMLFGFLKGGLIVQGTLIFLARFPIPEIQAALHVSNLASLFLRYAPALSRLLPQELAPPFIF
jgi:membrane protein required for colicin V production